MQEMDITMQAEQEQKAKPVISPIDVAVVGLGLMGRSITACLLAAGHHVIGLTNDMAANQKTPRQVRALLAEMKRQGLLNCSAATLMAQFKMSAQISDLSQCGIVFESVTEEVDLKRSIFRNLEAVVSDSTIIATNTSAIPVTTLQQGAMHPQRILGIHWDEPAHITRFMEIIPGKETGAEYIERIVHLAPSWGKEPSLLKREIRGFITNRISYAMFREACHLVDSGICTVEDVDRSLRNDVGWWMPFAGPFRYMDLMGVEGYFRVMKDLLPDLSTSPDVPPLIRNIVESGGRGISNGKGFYNYTESEAKRWEELYIRFNYEIRKLAVKYSDLTSESFDGAEGKK
jgi:3-hydroxybutyryl-CoA dehydrogenase